MTDLSAEFKALANYRPTHKVRFVTAASLFDGHDAAINIMRRILQGMGAEVIHLGHNRSGRRGRHGRAAGRRAGHRHQLLPGRPRRVLQVHGRPAAPARRRAHPGVRRRRRRDRAGRDPRAARLRRDAHLQPRGRPAHGPGRDDRRDGDALRQGPHRAIAPTSVGSHPGPRRDALARPGAADHGARKPARPTPALRQRSCTRSRDAKHVAVLGITGTGGAGKSSLTDELIRRLRLDQDDALRIAVISIDPSRRKSGGALLGDRIRMNAINPWSRRPARLHALAGHARRRQRDLRGAARRDRRLQGGRLRPHHRRDLRHRPGRRGHRAATSTCRCT